MSGKVQPRRRRDRKKRKAKEEWDEGRAFYEAEPEEEDVEPIREFDSSNSDDDETHDDAEPMQGMTYYKIIFFILLLLLGAVASFALLEQSPSGEEAMIIEEPLSQEIHEQVLVSMPMSPVVNDHTDDNWPSDVNQIKNNENDAPVGISEEEESTSFLENFIQGFTVLQENGENEQGLERSEEMPEVESVTPEGNAIDEIPEANQIEEETEEVKAAEIPAELSEQSQIESPVQIHQFPPPETESDTTYNDNVGQDSETLLESSFHQSTSTSTPIQEISSGTPPTTTPSESS